MKLSDVATITADHAPLIGDAAVGGQGGLLLVVEKFPGADTIAVTDGVEAALSDLRPGLGGMHVSTSAYRPATYIEQAVSRLTLWLTLAGLLALLGVGLLVRSWRAALVSAISVVVAVAVSTLALWAVGMGANAVVLAGLVAAVGVVIDDAVVDVWRRRRRTAPHPRRRRAARGAHRRVVCAGGRGIGGGARVHHGGACSVPVLPAGRGLPARGGGVHARRADGDPGAIGAAARPWPGSAAASATPSHGLAPLGADGRADASRIGR